MCTLTWVAWMKCLVWNRSKVQAIAGRTGAGATQQSTIIRLVVRFRKSNLFTTQDRQPKCEDMTGEARRGMTGEDEAKRNFT